MQKFKIFLLLVLAVIMLVACSPSKNDNSSTDDNDNSDKEENNEEIDQEVAEESDVEEEEPDATEDSTMLDYFLPEGTKSHFKGEGNEFAELDVEVIVANEDYAIIDVDNGGVLVRTIYKIEENRIDIVSTEPIDYEEDVPTVEEIKEMKPIEVYLERPFKKGNTFGEWTIIEVSATVETPYKTFNDAIVIESSDENFVNQKVFVKGYGEVKYETNMDTDDEFEFIVTSLLESVEE